MTEVKFKRYSRTFWSSKLVWLRENHAVERTDLQSIKTIFCGKIKVGKNINQWVEGDEVIIHCNVVNEFDNLIQQDGMLSKSQSIWGYETNYGAFAEYTKVRASQLIRKPKNLDWNTAASFCLTLSTAYRMLVSDNGSPIKAGETCLIWGAAGGLGSFAIQLAKLSGANVIARILFVQI